MHKKKKKKKKSKIAKKKRKNVINFVEADRGGVLNFLTELVTVPKIKKYFKE
jgi:hypothetical protein